MIIYLAGIFPILTAIILVGFFKKHLAWWEISIPFLVCVPLIILSKGCSEYAQTSDTEYWGSLVTTAEYYEDWNERVSCRHDKYCTRTVRDSNGRSSTERYVCGKEHSYDVDYHSAHWQLLTNCNERLIISESEYLQLANQFGNKQFVELNRNYHTDDGDKYISRWNGEELSARPVVTQHIYENRVQAAKDVFNFESVSDSDKVFYGLFDYPEIKNYSCRSLLGYDDGIAEKKLRYLNGYLGPKKQLRIWVLVFKNKPRDAGILQEAYWKGANKNEFVVAIGIDSTSRAVRWCYSFSWTEVQSLKIYTQQFVEKQDSLDIRQTVAWLGNELESKFIRKRFRDFSYLTVEPSGLALFITFLSTILVCCAVAIWVIKNDFE